eukprot:CAMPEP_0114115230 /NCGR_PEP_ID=MMETSP0043_2-20121206/3860_1 /TAXON_ID=464988 /ORGANISM="Hemiselmis andersenii, Strain CCMP644" /LENGTH=309 /DNA_ID=CAMNT_0001207483 /DNA_START=6 /DNA_END=931 /DNA_ORIENTATION=+
MSGEGEVGGEEAVGMWGDEMSQVQRLLEKLREEREGRVRAEEDNATLKAQIKKLRSQLSREQARGEAESRRANDEVAAAQAQVEIERKKREMLRGRAEALVREARARVAVQVGEAQQERIKAQREADALREEVERVKAQAKVEADRAWRAQEKIRATQQHDALTQTGERGAAAKAKSALRAQVKGERFDTEIDRAEEENMALRDELVVAQSQAERLRQQVKLARQQAPIDESPPPEEPSRVEQEAGVKRVGGKWEREPMRHKEREQRGDVDDEDIVKTEENGTVRKGGKGVEEEAHAGVDQDSSHASSG